MIPRRLAPVISRALMICLAACPGPLIGDSGGVDRAFAPVFSREQPAALPGSVCSAADGDIIVAGGFQVVNGTLAGSVVRLRSDGAIVPEFRVPMIPWTYAAAVTALPGQRFLISGDNLFSVDALGTPDGRINYRPCTGSSACGGFSAIAVQPDGAVFVTRPRLPVGLGFAAALRFTPDGHRDTNWWPAVSGHSLITGAAADSQGRLVIAGWFQRGGTASRVYRLGRLTPTGLWDETFAPSLALGCESPDDTIATTARLAIQPDGRIVLAASWRDCDLTDHSAVYRLLEDGTLDPEFAPASLVDQVTALALQADGHILVAGTGGVACLNQRAVLRRLQPDGRLDATFNPVFTWSNPCVESRISAILAERDRIWVVGSFDRVNGIPVPGMALLQPHGAVTTGPQTRFGELARVDSAVSDSRGAVFASGRTFDSVNGVTRRFLAKLYPDGSLDSSFNLTDPRLINIATRQPLLPLPTRGPEVLLLSSNRPIARLLASGAVDGRFALPSPLTGLVSEWHTRLDAQDRLVCMAISNRVLRAFRLNPDGGWDSSYTPFLREPTSSWSVSGNATALDAAGRLLIAGPAVSNTFNGIVRLKPGGGPDPSFGPPPIPLAAVAALTVTREGNPVVLAGTPARPLWLSLDGRKLEGASSLPPLPGGEMRSNSVRGFMTDARDRLYLVLRLSNTNFTAYRFTADRHWDRGFVVNGTGGDIGASLSADGDWLYLAGTTEVNGVRSGGVLRVSTLEQPAIEALGASPFFGNVLRLTGEPGRRHRLEVSRDLRQWEPLLDLTLGDEPTLLSDWFGWGEPQRFYRLSLIEPW